MKKLIVLFVCIVFGISAKAQQGYEITIHLKNCKDTLAFLTFYQFDKTLLKDTCTTIKDGKIVFKGKKKLERGMYSLVSQQKSIYFDFIVDENNQKLDFTSEMGANMYKELVCTNSKQQNDFFDYGRFVNNQNKEFEETKKQTKGLAKKDSIAKLVSKQKLLDKLVQQYDEDFYGKNKGTYLGDIINLKMDKLLKEVPKDDKGKPDSTQLFKFYKKHYWDNVDFQDEATIRNPFFVPKVDKYFNAVVYTHPDSVCVEIDRMMNRLKPNSLFYKFMLAHLTYSYETSKIMGFDKVFVYISDNYFKKGKAAGIYDDESVVQKIIKRADKLKPLLVGAVAQDLFMIRAEDFDKMKKMGFESAKNSDEMTKVFYKNANEVNNMFVKLSNVKAEYTLLLFWDVDCGHCQKEIPKILDVYNELIKEKKDVKVYSVYMQHEGEKYLKYIAEHKLPWINVYDGAHYNNAIEKYDVYSTPVLYILDKNKVIKAKRIGAEQIKDIIGAIEAENKQKTK